MSCPLCNEEHSRPSWLGTTTYRGKEFPYVECLACKSLYCDPMPDEETVIQMYGPDYVFGFEPDPQVEESREAGRVLEWLAKTQPRTFLDYGCGEGKLLTAAAGLGWKVLGIEFDEKVARQLETATQMKVITAREALSHSAIADVLHLGDVIEHMTNINEQMVPILKLIKPGGLLIAQGPLEANLNLFMLGIRLARSLRRSTKPDIAPYHVMLATKEGQHRCFRRFNLSEKEFLVTEVAWPARAHLLRSDILSPRTLSLFALRRFSRAVSSIQPGWGNRYFYVGRHGGSAA